MGEFKRNYDMKAWNNMISKKQACNINFIVVFSMDIIYMGLHSENGESLKHNLKLWWGKCVVPLYKYIRTIVTKVRGV